MKELFGLDEISKIKESCEVESISQIEEDDVKELRNIFQICKETWKRIANKYEWVNGYLLGPNYSFPLFFMKPFCMANLFYLLLFVWPPSLFIVVIA